MTWNERSASSGLINAVDGNNPPIALSPKNFLTSISSGDTSSLISYEINSTEALVFAHSNGSTLGVKAFAIDSSTIFSQELSISSGSGKLEIVYCELSNRLAVFDYNVNGALRTGLTGLQIDYRS